MGLFKKKPKRLKPVIERTFDEVPFVIPKIKNELINKSNILQPKSPLYGTSISDKIYYPENKSVDVIKQYDAFRKVKKYTLEDEKKDEKGPYSEFNQVPRNNFASANVSESVRKKHEEEKKLTKEQEMEYEHSQMYNGEVHISKPIDIMEGIEVQEKPEYQEEPIIDLEEEIEQVQEESPEQIEENHFQAEQPNIDANGEETIDLNLHSLDEVEVDSSDDLFDMEDDDEMEMQDEKPLNQSEPKEDKPEELYVATSKSYRLPPLSLLNEPEAKAQEDKEIIEREIAIINQTLRDFKVDGEVINHTVGPALTRYEIALSGGVSAKKVETLKNDFQMRLSSITIEIEAPIPGKSTVGIQIPNVKRRNVSFKEVIDRPEFLNSKDPLYIPLGLTIDGEPAYTSINKLPHALIAGATQSGKSVFLSSLILSLIYKNTPDTIRFIFVDPKKVDLQQFATIPHLLAPSIDSPKDAILYLNWLVGEMERRLTLLSKTHTVNLDDYYERAKDHPLFERLPRIIMVIEEASDLLLNGGADVETPILILAQKARAAGIHLILAMQRPSAQIFNSNIKANFSGRFALKVPSAVNSQIILDEPGAENLLGFGDMIFSCNGYKTRVQSPFLTPVEISKVCAYLQTQQPEPNYVITPETLIRKQARTEKKMELDDKFFDVVEFVLLENRCSQNQISRKFNMSFNRAQAIVEMMEYYGIVSPNVGTKAREVLVSYDELPAIKDRVYGDLSGR